MAKRYPTAIFLAGCELAPIYNVIAMARAVNDFGWYD
jgi:hypothetical protein